MKMKQIRTTIKALDCYQFFHNEDLLYEDHVLDTFKKRIETYLNESKMYLTIQSPSEWSCGMDYTGFFVKPEYILGNVLSISEHEIEVLIPEDKFEVFQRFVAQGYYAKPRILSLIRIMKESEYNRALRNMETVEKSRLESAYLIAYDLRKDEE